MAAFDYWRKTYGFSAKTAVALPREMNSRSRAAYKIHIFETRFKYVF
jgi:hypothetical protein